MVNINKQQINYMVASAGGRRMLRNVVKKKKPSYKNSFTKKTTYFTKAEIKMMKNALNKYKRKNKQLL